jgi:anti-sigma B factor antagonist
MMDVTARVIGEVAVVDLSGQLASPETVSQFRSALKRLLDDGYTRILINLHDVPYLDSSGLGELLAAKKAALVAGAQLKMLRPGKRVYSLIAETGLSKVFECFQDEQAAIQSFDPADRGPRG